MIMKSYKYHINSEEYGFPWMVGMLYTAHKVLHTYVVISLPSSNDAYRPPLARIMYPGQLSKEGPKDQRGSKQRSLPFLVLVDRRGGTG